MLKSLKPGVDEMITNGSTGTKKDLYLSAVKSYNDDKSKSHRMSSDERDGIKNLAMCDEELVVGVEQHYNQHKHDKSGNELSKVPSVFLD